MSKKPTRRRAAKRATPAADLLTVKEAAAFLRIHENTMRRLLDRGALTKVRVGAAVRVQRAELEVYVHGGGDDANKPRPVTPDMLAALHARSKTIDERRGVELGSTKARILRAATERFGHEISSANDLSVAELYWVLDRLREALAELPRN